MRHRLRLAPLLLGSLCVLTVLRPAARAEDGMGGATAPEGSTREFPEHNFKWTVPAKWQFADPVEADKAAGYVVTAKRVVSPGVEVTGYVLVRDAGGVSVDANLQQVRDNKSRKLTDVDAKIETAAWAGAEQGHVLRILGKAENKGVVASLVYGGIVSGKYHQLDLRSVNGANHEIEAEIAAAAKGYHFFAGAKADEDPAPAPGAEPSAGDGFKRRFEKLGLTWTLPKAPEPTEPPPGSDQKEPSKYDVGWGTEGKKDIAPLEKGLAAVAILGKDGAAAVTITLELPDTPADMSSLDLIKEEGHFEKVKDNFDGAPMPNVDSETHLGNALASSRTFAGKGKDGRPLWIRFYATTIKRQVYLSAVTAHERAEVTNKDWIKAALDGLHWDDTKSGVRGPYVTPFPTASENRGSGWQDFDKKAPFKQSGVSLTKTPAFGRLKFVATDDPYKTWVFGAEARAPEGLVFVGIRRFDAKAFQTQKKEPDSLIDDFENEWKNGMDEPKTRPKSEKQNKKAGSFRGGQGSTYDFTGTKEGNPVVEHGWVVKSAQNVFWVRVQFVGKDAEKALGDEWDGLMKSIKFE